MEDLQQFIKPKIMGKLILIRHGKSLWNLENIFTGWTDIDLAPEGVEEAKKAGEILKKNKIGIDICFSSFLKRAIRTNWILLETAEMMNVDCLYSWRLNERNYGAWQGRNKDEVKAEVGEDMFLKVRRGYSTPPPKLEEDDHRHPKFDPLYKSLNKSLLPASESLEDTRKRAVPYFFECIAPQMVKGKTVVVAAHGNSLRALIAQIRNIPKDEIPGMELATGIPFMYEFDDNLNLKEYYELT